MLSVYGESDGYIRKYVANYGVGVDDCEDRCKFDQSSSHFFIVVLWILLFFIQIRSNNHNPTIDIVK